MLGFVQIFFGSSPTLIEWDKLVAEIIDTIFVFWDTLRLHLLSQYHSIPLPASGVFWYGQVLSRMVPFGRVWSHMIPYGPVWSLKF